MYVCGYCTGVWETLLVGSIPVTVSSPMDTLLRRLPVLIVDDWDEITQQAYLYFFTHTYMRAHARAHTRTPNSCVCELVCVGVCVCACERVCARACVCTRIHSCMYVRRMFSNPNLLSVCSLN